MSTSELVTSLHLQKKAIIYIRQSTPHQQISNQESLRLQYALRERAQRLGWHAEDVEIIDADLGLTGASAQHRTGFQELVAKVTLGQVGLILSVDVTRLSRNCSDWYPLLDVCGYRGCLIADNDGIYDPGSANGRLLLGLKGQLSELELHTIRARMTAGLLGHQRRAVNSPSRSQSGWYVMLLTVSTKIPIRRFKIAWTWFLRPSCGCVRKASSWGSSTLKTWLCPDEIALETWSGKSRPWRSSCKSSRILLTREPLSTGAPAAFEDDPAALRSKQVRLPMEQWRIRVNDVYPAYICLPDL